MKIYSKKLNLIAKDTDMYLKSIFFKKKNKSCLIKPMKYGLFSGGKRFRSTIVVNVGKIFEIDYKKLIIVGSVIECIHAYSLIHDDLPAMDNDILRRGKLTTHKKFNEFTAILAGNSLLTLGFEILAGNDLKLSQRIKNELIKSLSVCSGFSGLAEGQYHDLSFEKKKISKKNIINMQKKKTGKLFSFCCESASIINGDNLKKRKIWRDIGLDIGLLFQIADDLINYKGNEFVVGKPVKSDKKKGKATLINLLGYKKTLIFVEDLKKQLSLKIKKYGDKGNDLLESLEFILSRNF